MTTDRLERARNILFDGEYTGEQQGIPTETVSVRSSFTIHEAKAMKHDLAKRIEGLLLEFSEATGLTVDYINVETVEDFSGSIERYRVAVEAKL